MAFIKKLVMHGFKSFPRKTELPFTSSINVILGPNGSGKSNISDAICFVLGRLSIKSMRAARARNLIFLGTKVAAPAKEASVEIIFDNSDRSLSLDQNEISIKRIVRRNGQSIYKINNETKTRQEVLTLLAQAGIDPNGFNIILQGEIQNFVRMHTEERRKIIEEVSGISIYEVRKAKSLHELEKTEEKLKEIMAILRERTAYLNNLEKERQQALRYKKLEKQVKMFKASIIYHDLTKKRKEKEAINLEIEKKNKEIEKTKKMIFALETCIQDYQSKIDSINEAIQKSTGIEQESLNQQIANLRAEIAGMNVKLENYEKRISDIENQKKELQKIIRDDELAIKQSQKEPISNKQKKLEEKKKQLEELEEQRKKFYVIKSDLRAVKERLQDKLNLSANYKTESELLLKQIDTLSIELFDKKSHPSRLEELKKSLAEKKQNLENLNKKEIELEKTIHTDEHEMDKYVKLKDNISKMDICPLCKNKITELHIKNIYKETEPKINSLKTEIEKSEKELNNSYDKKDILKTDIEQLSDEISKRQSDILKLSNINGKKSQIKTLHEKIEKTKQELTELEKRKKSFEEKFEFNSNIEQKCEIARIEVQEISLLSERNIESEISFKQRELERSKIALKQLSRDEEELKEEAQELKRELEENENLLEQKREQEEALNQKCKKLISQRDTFQGKIREAESEILQKQNVIHNIEQSINELKVAKAKVDAEVENFEIEMLDFKNVETIKLNRETLLQKLNKTQDVLSKIGTVNLRSLEVYDSIKKEYDVVKERVELITKEKEGILTIIHEIDVKKKKTFFKTLNQLNELFSRNFSQLSTKGHVFLELENRKNPFEAGVSIIVKTGHGKYFDVTSLSGGEQTIVALSLIFAIQELKPYCFYILDEIDAALDKRNSERLAGLLRKYMQKGQYIIITHNDEVISRATNLYGVSMHEGISKIVSLQV